MTATDRIPEAVELVEIPTLTHEKVLLCREAATGLVAVIAVHSTALGPALGGTRFKAYESESEGIVDVLRLSEGMTYKAAAAGLPLGGGKAIIMGDPDTVKTPELLAAYGRFVEQLDGLYVTAADVGTNSSDLDVIGAQTRHVVGRSEGAGGSGDSGFSTALGVYHSMRAAAGMVWGYEGLVGRRVGVEGVGKVGRQLVQLLLADGAEVLVADTSDAALRQLSETHAGCVIALPSVLETDVDIYAPCALGATLDEQSVPRLRARIVCGAANNQLSAVEVDQSLLEHDVVWVPDYVANAGGLIQVGGELLGRNADEVRRDVVQIGETVRQILQTAMARGIPTGHAAKAYAESRLEQGGQGA